MSHYCVPKVRQCNSCLHWVRERMQPTEEGYSTAACEMSRSRHMGDRPLDQKRGSDTCMKWKKLK